MEKKDFETVIERFQTPCYVFDLDILEQRVRLIQKILRTEITTCYAMKANPFLIRPMDAYIDRFEVCSPGEYEICMRQGIAPEKIVVSGVNKTFGSMDRIMELSKGKGIFTIESFQHYDILSWCAREYGFVLEVYLRLSSSNQFGMDKETLEKVIQRAKKDQYINVIGIHYYSGTQKKLKKVGKEVEELSEYGAYLKESYGLDRLELEYGPGLSVAYFDSDKVDDAQVQLLQLRDILNKTDVFSHISIEMGRFIASECGYYITEAVDVKTTENVNYCIVDGGIHQLNYYGQLMGMKKPKLTYLPQRTENIGKWNLCGSLCTINDVIVRDLEIGAPKIGDHIVFHTCGAYSVTEGMALFLSRELPTVLFYSGSRLQDSVNKGFQCVRKPMGTDIINSQEARPSQEA